MASWERLKKMERMTIFPTKWRANEQQGLALNTNQNFNFQIVNFNEAGQLIADRSVPASVVTPKMRKRQAKSIQVEELLFVICLGASYLLLRILGSNLLNPEKPFDSTEDLPWIWGSRRLKPEATPWNEGPNLLRFSISVWRKRLGVISSFLNGVWRSRSGSIKGSFLGIFCWLTGFLS